ncbi:helix-turn-helix domain-containing protein [Paraburkholderia sp. BCC1885]|uniref:helix-turn-helix domain-containing protein n=1 Tax=Paraburkholderia sp. BCC1885 TaxID=2562669 RepID=UPI001183D3C6|nr:helix-turn-helix domain-containing protein [Paraburkholderia sp. BCC1885]
MVSEKTKEFVALRRKGMRMLQRGVSQAEVTRTLGVSRQTASRWAALLAEDSGSLRERKRGRPSALTDKQMRRLGVLVCRGPKANGFATYAWSVGVVVELIEREFDTPYKAANVRRILKGMGLYKQRRVKVEKSRRLEKWPMPPPFPYR